MLPATKTGRHYFYLYYFIVYVLLSVYIAIHFIQFITDNDAFLYLSIADKYASGHFYEAVNDYWSPFFSLLLAPFLFFKIDPIVSIRVLNVLIGGFTFIAFLKIISDFKLRRWIEFFTAAVAVLLITYFSVEETADLLFAGCVLWYFYFIGTENFLIKGRNLVLIAFIGAVLYFTKAIGFYIFLAHITFCFLYWFCQKKASQTEIAKKYLTVIIVFAVLSSIWIATLSFKYHHLTISDAGKYNFAIVGPGNVSLQGIKEPLKHPINNGVYQLPDRYSLNYWERPQVSTTEMHWNPLDSKNNFIFFLHLLRENLLRLYYDIIFRLTFVVWMLSIVLIFFLKRKNTLQDFKVLSVVSLSTLVVLPYVCVFIVPRYLLPAELLLCTAAAYNFNAIATANYNIKVGVVFILFFAVINLGRYWLISFKQYDKSEKKFQLGYDDISKLRGLNLSGEIVSLQSGYDAILKTSLLSYYAHNPYKGQILIDSLQVRNDYPLIKNNVRYLFTWDLQSNKDSLFTNFNTVFLDTTSHLRIFDVTHQR